MTETANIPLNTLPQPGNETGSLRTARDARICAAAVRQPTTADEIKGLSRLRHAVSSGQPLRTDVPRGYYLNISV